MSIKANHITSLYNPRLILDFLFPALLLSRPSRAHRIVVGLSNGTITKGVNPISPLLIVDEVRRTRSLGGSRPAGRGPTLQTGHIPTLQDVTFRFYFSTSNSSIQIILRKRSNILKEVILQIFHSPYFAKQNRSCQLNLPSIIPHQLPTSL